MEVGLEVDWEIGKELARRVVIREMKYKAVVERLLETRSAIIIPPHVSMQKRSESGFEAAEAIKTETNS